MLLVVSVAWLLLTTPYAVFTQFVRDYSSDPQTKSVQRLVRVICFLLMYVNHAVNFLLYCLTGRKFRVELKELVSSTCRRPARRWTVTSPSFRTTRSNCVELEPLNDSTRAHLYHQHRQGTARRAFFVGEPANEVVVVVAAAARDVNDDVMELKSDGHLVEDAM